MALGGVSGPPTNGRYNPLVETFVANDVAAGETTFSIAVTGGPSWGVYETALVVELYGPPMVLDEVASTLGTSTTTSLTASGITTSISGELELTAAGWNINPTSATGPTGSTAVTDLTDPQPLGVWFQSPPSGATLSSTVTWGPTGPYDSSLSLLTLEPASG